MPEGRAFGRNHMNDAKFIDIGVEAAGKSLLAISENRGSRIVARMSVPQGGFSVCIAGLASLYHPLLPLLNCHDSKCMASPKRWGITKMG